MFYILKDGRIQEQTPTQNHALVRLQKLQPMSFDWATKYEGWEIIDLDEFHVRRTHWLDQTGTNENDVMEDENGEYVIDVQEDYAHPDDVGAGISEVIVYLEYFKIEN